MKMERYGYNGITIIVFSDGDCFYWEYQAQVTTTSPIETFTSDECFKTQIDAIADAMRSFNRQAAVGAVLNAVEALLRSGAITNREAFNLERSMTQSLVSLGLHY